MHDRSSTLAASLEQAAGEAGYSGARISNLSRLSGGASKETWGFSLDAGEQRIELVLRCEPALSRFAVEGTIPLGVEAALLRIARRHDVPVPRVFFELPPESAFPGYAMARVEGETVGARILKAASLAKARDGFAVECGRILAALHSIPIEVLPPLERYSGLDLLARYRERYLDIGQHRPIFDLAFNWIEDRLDHGSLLTFVHGDFRNGNLVVGSDGVRAVLDWEQAHIGHPAEDLGWLCATSWRFQRPDLRVGGFGHAEELLTAYADAGGRSVDLRELLVWEAFASLRWGVMCGEVGARFLNGIRSVEGAMIARRASETEYDLMRLIGGENA